MPAGPRRRPLRRAQSFADVREPPLRTRSNVHQHKFAVLTVLVPIHAGHNDDDGLSIRRNRRAGNVDDFLEIAQFYIASLGYCLARRSKDKDRAKTPRNADRADWIGDLVLPSMGKAQPVRQVGDLTKSNPIRANRRCKNRDCSSGSQSPGFAWVRVSGNSNSLAVVTPV